MRLNVLFHIGTPPVVLIRVVQINVEFNDLLGGLLNYCFHEAALLLKLRRLLEQLYELKFWDHLLKLIGIFLDILILFNVLILIIILFLVTLFFSILRLFQRWFLRLISIPMIQYVRLIYALILIGKAIIDLLGLR